MIISHRHKFIFIKTRKTAGSSIEKYLINYLGPEDICTGSEADNTPALNTSDTDGHKGWKWIETHYPTEWKTYYKFAVERNPWDKLASAYFYYKRYKHRKVPDGFKPFIRLNALKQNDWNMYARGSDIKVDSLIDYTTLHESFLKLPVPYNNELLKVFVKRNPRRKNYSKLYDKETKDIVSYRFSNVIEYFSYDF